MDRPGHAAALLGNKTQLCLRYKLTHLMCSAKGPATFDEKRYTSFVY